MIIVLLIRARDRLLIQQFVQEHRVLGLSLCRRLAEELGGTLMAESREGKGSRFTLSLPNRQLGTDVSDIAFDYSGGFNKTLLALADAMPVDAFLIRNQN